MSESNGKPTDRRVFLGMPSYGQMALGAGRGLWRACADTSRVIWEYREGSLLAQNFNRLWCAALNRVRRGQRIDYFAMIHSDVQPQDWWLDTLIDELERLDLDVLGVAVPIKEPSKGVSSIALDKPDRESFEPLCRLTMREIHRLPETFTSEDVGHPLLLNTGLWVCRFDPAWNKRVTFTINDEITFDKPSDMFVTHVEPEDWNFSRQCHEMGLRLGVTRKIRLTHRGEVEFPNHQPGCGEEFDSDYIEASAIPAVDRDGFRYPSEVDGWLLFEEGKQLWELSRGKRVLEIGSFCGKSTICIAQTADHVTAVDPHDGRGTPTPRNTYDEFWDNLTRYGLDDKVRCQHPDKPLDGEFDVAFIDGAHDYESVRADIERALRVLKPGGLLAFHDYRPKPGDFDGRWDPGVSQAVNELLGDGGELISTHATLAVVRPSAGILLEV